jgi:CBS domain-containing protein
MRPGAERGKARDRRKSAENVKINELMANRVIAVEPHHSVDHVRSLLARNKIHAVPVVGPSGEALGIVTSADLLADLKSGTPISKVMSPDVHAVPAYNDASVAARIMRKNKIHHVVVTHEKRVVGIVSSFDLLKLVEGRRFVAKKAPERSKKARRA